MEDRSPLVPAADVYEVEGTVVIRLFLPGAIEEDVDIALGPGRVTVRGELEPPVDLAASRAVLLEWRYGYFERTVPLPDDVDARALKVVFEAGVLEIRLPRRRP